MSLKQKAKNEFIQQIAKTLSKQGEESCRRFFKQVFNIENPDKKDIDTYILGYSNACHEMLIILNDCKYDGKLFVKKLLNGVSKNE